MIAAATQVAKSFSFDNLPFGWFDGVLVVVLVFGLFRGRKNGMTKEILPALQWVVIIIAGGFGYKIAGDVIINLTGWDKLAAYLSSYLFLAFLVFLLFILIKKAFMPRLIGSNFFGNAEYYLGMISGLIRYTCMLIFALALLNAPFYTPAEIQAARIYNNRWYGGGLNGYSGNYFPTLQTAQEGVFKGSLTGPFIKDYLGVLLIDTAGAGADNSKSMPKKTPIIHIGT